MFPIAVKISAAKLVTAVLVLAAGAFSMAMTRPLQMVFPAARAAQPIPQFPLRISSNKKYLVDASGSPFLIHGDTAWSLIAQLNREDAELYLHDRQTRGFNAILVNLLEHRFSTNAPANAYGDTPFLVTGDFGTPNEAYFAHAEWVLQRAQEKGILVLLAPAYLGAGGGNEGWYRAMLGNGPEKLREYGEYLGNRFRAYPNILWTHAGDYNPTQKDLVQAIAEGIRAVDPRALHTAHSAPGTAALDYWAGEPWLHINNVYTYDPVYSSALAQNSRPSAMPFILIESAYENEHGAAELRIRTQAYHALLSGAAGQIFGNNPIWHFDGPGLYSAPVKWQDALSSRGSQSMTHLLKLFSSLEWWKLEPDFPNRLLAGSHWSTINNGAGHNQPVAARAHDGSFALVYLPQARTVAIDLSQLAGPRISARWYDPAGGTFAKDAGSPTDYSLNELLLRPPAHSISGLGDWALLLESHP